MQRKTSRCEYRSQVSSDIDYTPLGAVTEAVPETPWPSNILFLHPELLKAPEPSADLILEPEAWFLNSLRQPHHIAKLYELNAFRAAQDKPVADMFMMALDDAEAQFRDAARACGIELPAKLEADGRIHRFSTDTNGRRDGGKPGWYVLHLDEFPAGTFGDWSRDVKENWSTKPNGKMWSDVERRAYAKRMEALRRAREAEEPRKLRPSGMPLRPPQHTLT